MADYEVPNDPDNVAPSYGKQLREREIRERKQRDAEWLKSRGYQPPEEVDPEDPLAVRIFKNASEVPLQIVGGVAAAGQEVLESMDSIANWLNKNVADLSIPGMENAKVNIPQVDKPETVAGGLARGVSQFVTGFIPALRGVRAVTGGKAVTGAGKFMQASAAGGVTDAFVFDPHEERLSNLIQEAEVMGIDLANPVTQYLAASPEDSEAEGRFKNFIEGLGIGVAVDGLVAGLRAIRANRIANGAKPPSLEGGSPAPVEGTTRVFLTDEGKGSLNIDSVRALGEGRKKAVQYVDVPNEALGITPDKPLKADAKIAVPEEFMERVKVYEEPRIKGLAAPDENILTPIGDPKAKFLPKEVEQDYAKAKLKVADLYEHANWARLQTPENIDNVIQGFAKLIKGEKTDLIKKVGPNTGRSGVTVSDKTVQRLAENLSITPQDLLARQRFLKGNKALDAERIVAMGGLLDGATKNVVKLANKALASTDEKDLYAFVKMMNVHSAIQTFYKGATSEAGRALRAIQIPTGSTAKQIAALNQIMVEQGGADAIRQLAEAVKGVGSSGDINKALAKTRFQKAKDALVEFWYYKLLSGPQTHVANIMSTAINTVWQIPERALAAQFAKLRGATDSVQEGEATEMMFAMVESFKDSLRAVKETFVTGEAPDLFSKFDQREPLTPAISAKNFGLDGAEGSLGWFTGKAVDALGAFVRTPTRAIMSEDAYFRVTTKNMEMKALAFRTAKSEGLEGKAFADRVQEILRNPSDDMMEQVQRFTESVTFSRPLQSRFGREAMAWSNRNPTTKLVMPFIRTPVNLLKEAGKRTALAPLSSAIRKDIMKGGPEADLAMTRITLGSMVSLVMADLAFSGVVTGSGPTEPTLQATWRASGKQPYSIKIGDKWYSYNRADPMGLFIGATAAFAEVAGSATEMEAEELAKSIAVAVSQSVFNKTWMRGPTELLDAITQPDRYGDKYITQFAGSLFSSAASAQITREIDPVWRDVNSIVDAIKSRTPGLSETLPPRRNIWGQPIYLEGGLGPDIVSPVYTNTDKKDPLSDFIVKERIKIDLPDRIQFGIELTPQEYSEFTERAGKLAYSQLSKDFGTEAWNKLSDGSDGSKAWRIKEVIQKARDQVRSDMRRTMPELNARITKAEISKSWKLKYGG